MKRPEGLLLPHNFACRNCQSQRDCGTQPRVAKNELPWGHRSEMLQPQRGCGHRTSPQGSTPLGLMIFWALFPRVARASQPWALGRNPVGIPGWREGVASGNRRGCFACATHDGNYVNDSDARTMNRRRFRERTRDQSERDCVLQPKVDGQRLPFGVRSEMETTPTAWRRGRRMRRPVTQLASR